MNVIVFPRRFLLAFAALAWLAGCQTTETKKSADAKKEVKEVKPPEPATPVRISVATDPPPTSDIDEPPPDGAPAPGEGALPREQGPPGARRDRVGRLLRSDKAFDQFAMAARREVSALLAALEQQDPESRKRNLQTRLDLALYLSENNVALSCISRLRQLEPNPERSAFTGMMAESVVTARRGTRVDSSNSRPFMQAFGKDFAKSIAELPKTVAVREVLEEQVAVLGAIDSETIEKSLREKIGPALDRGSHLTTEETSQLIAARHTLVDILPVRETALAVLNQALARMPKDERSP